VVGKYTDLHDAYKSVQEACIHGGIAHDAGVKIEWISSDRFTDQDAAGEILKDYDGLLIPGGFGIRGIEGMIQAIRWAREHGLPFFGICLGLQMAVVEFARTKCNLPTANSTEFDPECDTPVIHMMATQRGRREPGRHDAPRRVHGAAATQLEGRAGVRYERDQRAPSATGSR
jgi:CTP synthase